MLSKPIRQICQRKLIRSHRLKGGGGGKEGGKKKKRKERRKEGREAGRKSSAPALFLWIKIIRKKWVASILHEMEVIAASHGVFFNLFLVSSELHQAIFSASGVLGIHTYSHKNVCLAELKEGIHMNHYTLCSVCSATLGRI